ncbi:kinase-like domain-containing protein [Lipomyces tetrasporus]|uniref:Kinase-like domain-containing protein n=1 Tax=Lipomyces tetrasporus TaxID=54092 RepID=A0AAD7VVG4_9ASCO|nr:kinase-like domain-containing protein [Lipomyces tetrasporus]KAJ8102956.1 kinase-like domain-containing protein [Lipomyces tetrasporus]
MDSIHNYTDIDFHAEGAFSTIYRCRPVPTSPFSSSYSEVVLKVSNPTSQRAPHSPIRESELLQNLRHKHVIPLLSAFYDDSDLVLVMPYVPLHFTGDVVIDSATRATVVRDITSAIAFLHSQRLIHRDIKPQNILLASKSGPAYLSDFGTAWVPTTTKLLLKHLQTDVEPVNAKVTDVGTGPYRAPELLFGYPEYSESIDLWSWGCVIAELWHGRPVFDDDSSESSEISLVNAIFRKLGTPDVQTWPEAEAFPGFVHIHFVRYPPQPFEQLLPDAPPEAIEVIAGLLRYESGQRTAAEKLLHMKYFSFAGNNIE